MRCTHDMGCVYRLEHKERFIVQELVFQYGVKNKYPHEYRSRLHMLRRMLPLLDLPLLLLTRFETLISRLLDAAWIQSQRVSRVGG